MLTLTRLASTEKAKGYDDVIRAMADLEEFPEMKYILAGKFSDEEYKRINQLCTEMGVADRVEMPGFIPEKDIPGLFSKATLYVMPSTKEGFGIVFVEAMYFGLPVISSNADGSTDALRDGKFGLMVKPGDHAQLCEAIRKVLHEPGKFIAPFDQVMNEFGYENYKSKLLEIIKDEQG
jgi:glycosyltransferase involved in cell wall biosynthesis